MDIILDNDYPFRATITDAPVYGGMVVAGTGLGPQVFFALSPRSGPISINTTVVPTESVAGSGIYFGTFLGTAITADLAQYINQTVFIVVTHNQQLHSCVAVKIKER